MFSIMLYTYVVIRYWGKYMGRDSEQIRWPDQWVQIPDDITKNVAYYKKFLFDKYLWSEWNINLHNVY